MLSDLELLVDCLPCFLVLIVEGGKVSQVASYFRTNVIFSQPGVLTLTPECELTVLIVKLSNASLARELVIQNMPSCTTRLGSIRLYKLVALFLDESFLRWVARVLLYKHSWAARHHTGSAIDLLFDGPSLFIFFKLLLVQSYLNLQRV